MWGNVGGWVCHAAMWLYAPAVWKWNFRLLRYQHHYCIHTWLLLRLPRSMEASEVVAAWGNDVRWKSLRVWSPCEWHLNNSICSLNISHTSRVYLFLIKSILLQCMLSVLYLTYGEWLYFYGELPFPYLSLSVYYYTTCKGFTFHMTFSKRWIWGQRGRGNEMRFQTPWRVSYLAQ